MSAVRKHHEEEDWHLQPADEVSTTNLDSAYLERADLRLLPRDAVSTPQEQATTDWLRLLSTAHLDSEPDEDLPPAPGAEPSGMSEHISPARIAPTFGSRLSTGAVRFMLLVLLGGVMSVLILGGLYVVGSSLGVKAVQPQQAGGKTSAPAPKAVQPANNGAGLSGIQNVGVPAPQAPVQAEPTRQVEGKVDTADGQSLRERGVEQYRKGDFEGAVASLESATALTGDDAVAYYQLGLAYMALQSKPHSLEDAELSFRTAISLQPSWAAPHILLAESLLRRGFSKQAVTPAEEATRLDPSDGQAWLTLGRALRAAGRNAEATRAFAKGESAAPAPPMP